LLELKSRVNSGIGNQLSVALALALYASRRLSLARWLAGWARLPPLSRRSVIAAGGVEGQSSCGTRASCPMGQRAVRGCVGEEGTSIWAPSRDLWRWWWVVEGGQLNRTLVCSLWGAGVCVCVCVRSGSRDLRVRVRGWGRLLWGYCGRSPHGQWER